MNDEQLKSYISQARDGNQDAFTALYHATSQTVYQTIRSMVRDEHLALDIQQDVYVQAFTHLEQLRDETKFLPWLRAIAVNQTRSELRKQTQVLFTELEREDGSDVPEVPDERPENRPELQLEQKETSKLVQDILAELTDSQRLLVGMYYYEQIPVTRIAEDLGVSPGTVKTQLSRSRKKVETRVEELKAKGIKLYGLSPMPFLLALLKGLRPTKKAGNKVLAGALSEAGVTTETTLIHVSAGFFHTLAGRAVIALASVAVIGGGIAAYGWYQSRATEPVVGDVELHVSVYPTDDLDTPEDYIIDTEPTLPEEETDPAVETVEDSPEDMPEDPTDPEPTDPDPTDPEPTDPEPTDPEPAPPQPTTPQPTTPEPTDPEPTEPQPTDPEPSEPEPTEPEPTDPEPTEPDSTDPTGPEDNNNPGEEETDPDPTDQEPPEETVIPARILYWSIVGETEYNEISSGPLHCDVGRDLRVYIYCVGDEEPILFSDDSTVLAIGEVNRSVGDKDIRFIIPLHAVGEGPTNLRCVFADMTVFSIQVVVDPSDIP